MGIPGLEKFSHLEDKIYRTIELCKSLNQAKEVLAAQLETIRAEVNALKADKQRLEKQIDKLLEEREATRLKVEAMLDVIATLELEAESLRK